MNSKGFFVASDVQALISPSSCHSAILYSCAFLLAFALHRQGFNAYLYTVSCSQAAAAAPIYEQAGGPLDPLLAKMVPTDDYFPDRAFLFAFLLSARLFVQPHELLKRIMRLCDPKVRET